MDQMSLRSQSHFTIAMFTYGRISHEAEDVSHAWKGGCSGTISPHLLHRETFT